MSLTCNPIATCHISHLCVTPTCLPKHLLAHILINEKRSTGKMARKKLNCIFFVKCLMNAAQII